MFLYVLLCVFRLFILQLNTVSVFWGSTFILKEVGSVSVVTGAETLLASLAVSSGYSAPASVPAFGLNMSRVQKLRVFVSQRLNAALEDILAVFEKTIVKYEQEAALSQEVISRQHALLCALNKPLMEIPSTGESGPESPGPIRLQVSPAARVLVLTDRCSGVFDQCWSVDMLQEKLYSGGPACGSGWTGEFSVLQETSCFQWVNWFQISCRLKVPLVKHEGASSDTQIYSGVKVLLDFCRFNHNLHLHHHHHLLPHPLESCNILTRVWNRKKLETLVFSLI